MPEPVTETRTTTTYTVTLGGDQLSVANFGITEFLRKHTVFRVIFALAAIFVGVCSLASMSGVKTVPFINFFGMFTLVFVTPWMFWIATVSGPQFTLVFAPAKAQEERREAEKQFEVSKKPEDALQVDLARLNEYYVMNQSQVRSSFRWAKFAMVVGFATIIGGIWLFYFKAVQPDKFMAGVSTAAGSVVSLVSSLFFYLCTKTQERSVFYYGQLAQLQKLYVAIRLVDTYPDTVKQTEARDQVLRELLRGGGAIKESNG
jgi:hypothetical protein